MNKLSESKDIIVRIRTTEYFGELQKFYLERKTGLLSWRNTHKDFGSKEYFLSYKDAKDEIDNLNKLTGLNFKLKKP